MMEAATHFVEVVPEDMQTLGTEEEMLPPVSASVVSSSSIINMNTLIYSQGPDGIIMEGDEIGPDIVGEIVTDDSPDMKVLPTNQVIHMDLAREKHQEETTLGGLEGQGFMKGHALHSPVSQMLLQEGEANGEIILVPNSMIKQEDIIEGGEVVVGPSPDMAVEEALFEPTLEEDCRDLAPHRRGRLRVPGLWRGAQESQRIQEARPHAPRGVAQGGSQRQLCQLRGELALSALLVPIVPVHVSAARQAGQAHNEAQEYRCPFCPYTCTVYKAYRKHQKAHVLGAAKLAPVKLSCKICGKDRSTEADMQKHMKKHRSGENFVCDVCGFASIQLKKDNPAPTHAYGREAAPVPALQLPVGTQGQPPLTCAPHAQKGEHVHRHVQPQRGGGV
ncbi:hypothetical protein MRX96_003451 [Rhipicephalus microplus]